MHEPRSRSTFPLRFALVIGLAALLSACQQASPATTITIAVNPDQADLAPSETREFTAAVAGGSNASVAWSTTCGTITGSSTTIDYAAPPTAGVCVLTATSMADPSKSAAATITVREADEGEPDDDADIAIDPDTAQLAQGQTQDFTATVTGTSDTDVTWAATCGDVEGDGTTVTYTAPAEDGTCELVATSTADPSAIATATITVDAIGISIEPSDLEAFLGQSRTVTATVAGSSDTSVTWGLSPMCGTIDGTGATIHYTAPTALPPTRCAITATSNADPSKQATLAIRLHAAPRITLTATPATVAPGEELDFGWTLTNPSRTLALTCELFAFGHGVTPTYTIEDCGRRGSRSTRSHAYAGSGDYVANLTVRQGDLALSSASIDVRVVVETVRASTGPHTLALDRRGNVWAWGWNLYGQLGDGSIGSDLGRGLPAAVCASGSGPACPRFNLGDGGTVRTGYAFSLAVDGTGKVWAWGGDGGVGALGDGTWTDRVNPVPVCASGSGSGCVQLDLGSHGAISAGSHHSLAIDSDGSVWAWGLNGDGRLGDGTTTNRGQPVPVCASGSGAACVPFQLGPSGQVAAGDRHSLAIDSDGRVWSWGSNSFRQLGIGVTPPRLNPVPVCATGSGASCVQLELGSNGRVAAGVQHSVARHTDGRVWAWGGNGSGQIGDGTTVQRANPVAVCAVGSGSGCTQLTLGERGDVAAGDHHTLAVDDLGNVLAWGSNFSGQLGDGGAPSSQPTPVPVCASGTTDGTCIPFHIGPTGSIGAGWFNSVAIDGSGAVWAWGSNGFGQTGDGTTDDRANPVPVAMP